MKTKLIVIMLFTFSMVYSQKSKNGTVYNEHPAIEAVESMWQAFFAKSPQKPGMLQKPNIRKNPNCLNFHEYCCWSVS